MATTDKHAINIKVSTEANQRLREMVGPAIVANPDASPRSLQPGSILADAVEWALNPEHQVTKGQPVVALIADRLGVEAPEAETRADDDEPEF